MSGLLSDNHKVFLLLFIFLLILQQQRWDITKTYYTHNLKEAAN